MIALRTKPHTPGQRKVLSVLSHGPYPIYLLANLFPYRGKITAMSLKSARSAVYSLEDRGEIESFRDPNDSPTVYYVRLKRRGHDEYPS